MSKGDKQRGNKEVKKPKKVKEKPAVVTDTFKAKPPVNIGEAWIQVASATPGLKASISSAIASAGVLQPRVFLGRLFSSAATSFSHV